VLFEGLFELETAMIGPEGDLRRMRGAGRGLGALAQKAKQGDDALLDLIPAIQIDLVRAPDGVADVLLKQLEGFVEFAQQKRLLGRLRVQQQDAVHVAVGHADDVIRRLNQVGRQHAAADVRNVYAQFLDRLNRERAGRLTVGRAQPGRHGLEVILAGHRPPKKAFSHRAAADVSGADKKNGLHGCAMLKNLRLDGGIVNVENQGR